MPEETKETQGRFAASDEEQFITLEELCGEDPKRDQAKKFLERYGKWILYRTRIPLDMLLRLQKKFMSGKNRDVHNYFVALLEYLLLNPHVDHSQADLLLKADGRVMLEVVGETLGDISALREEVAEEAGE